MSHSEIVGSWSVDIMYAPGAQEDERIIFMDNGTGWLEFLNWDSILVETFNWSINPENKLSIRGVKKFANYAPYQRKSTLQIIDLSFEVKIKQTPSGKLMKTIAFSTPIVPPIKEYGLESDEVDESVLKERISLVQNIQR